MKPENRNELIDGYFRVIDQKEYEGFRDVYAESVIHCHPSGEELHGVDEVIAFFEGRDGPTEPSHEVRRRNHTEPASFCEGRYTGTIPNSELTELDFCNRVEFDEDEAVITRNIAYTRPVSPV